MQDIIQIIKDLGFPIFVAVWMLVQNKTEQSKTRDAIEKLTIVIEKLTVKLDDDNHKKE